MSGATREADNFANGLIIEQESIPTNQRSRRGARPPAFVFEEASSAERSAKSGSRRLLAEERTAVQASDSAILLAMAEDELCKTSSASRYAQELEGTLIAQYAGEDMVSKVHRREALVCQREIDDVEAVSKRELQKQKEVLRAQDAIGKAASRSADREVGLQAGRLEQVARRHGADLSDFMCVRSLQQCLDGILNYWVRDEDRAAKKQLLTCETGGRIGDEDCEEEALREGVSSEERSLTYFDDPIGEELLGELQKYKKELKSRESAKRAAELNARRERKATEESRSKEKELEEQPWMSDPEQLPGIREALAALDEDELLELRKAFDVHGHEVGTMSMAMLLQVFAKLGLCNETAKNHARQLRKVLPSREHEVLNAGMIQRQVRMPGDTLEQVAPDEEHFVNLGEAAIILAKMRFCVYDNCEDLRKDMCD